MATVTIDLDVLQKTFDTAVNSMDFSSGFLDDEEVTALRACAVVLGVDPLQATPQNFICKYRESGHRWYVPFGESSEWRRDETGIYSPERSTRLVRSCEDCRHMEYRNVETIDMQPGDTFEFDPARGLFRKI
jgi:hypothetical protein